MKLNFILPEESTDLATGWHTHARARACTRTNKHTHKQTHTYKGINPTGRKPGFKTSTRYILGNANAGGTVTFKPYNSKST